MEPATQNTQEPASSNCPNLSPNGNLIDLNTHIDNNKSQVSVNSDNLKQHIENCTCMDNDGMSEVHGSISDTSSLYASHIESGYFTGSLTSTSTLGREQNQTDGSDGDITPSLDNVFCLNDTSHVDCSTDQTEDALASLSLNTCDIKLITGNTDFDKIISGNEIRLTPENLSLPDLLQMYDNTYYKDDNNIESVIPAQVHRNGESRKRSKSSGFPFPRVKEGAETSDCDDIMSRSLPHGQLLRSGHMVEFIADDLQQKIRESGSSISKTDSSDKSSSRRSSLLSVSSTASSAMATSMTTSMTSGMSRSLQSPDCIPPIDPSAVLELEHQARLVADSLDLMMGNLKNNLHKMSAISVGCEEAYKMSVDMTCDSVDSSIKSMYALMAKFEQLSTSMNPVYKIADQIKDIKRLLDRFESQLSDKP